MHPPYVQHRKEGEYCSHYTQRGRILFSHYVVDHGRFSAATIFVVQLSGRENSQLSRPASAHLQGQGSLARSRDPEHLAAGPLGALLRAPRRID